jgi:hypothetical protein
LLPACGRREERAFFDSPVPTEVPAVIAVKPLPASAFDVEWAPLDFPRQAVVGSRIPVRVTFKNASNTAWPDNRTADPQQASGAYAVRLGYSWLREGRPVTEAKYSPDRVDLEQSLAPGQSATLDLSVLVPAEPGDYRFSMDLVQELVTWFSGQGADAPTFPVRVVRTSGATRATGRR